MLHVCVYAVSVYFHLCLVPGLRPRRTLRTVLWTAEEQGGVGAQQYFDRHKVPTAINGDACCNLHTCVDMCKGVEHIYDLRSSSLISLLLELVLPPSSANSDPTPDKESEHIIIWTLFSKGKECLSLLFFVHYWIWSIQMQLFFIDQWKQHCSLEWNNKSVGYYTYFQFGVNCMTTYCHSGSYYLWWL